MEGSKMGSDSGHLKKKESKNASNDDGAPVPLRHLTTLEDDIFFRPVVFLENGSIPRVVLAADAATESMLLRCLLRAVCVVRCTNAFQKMSNVLSRPSRHNVE